MPRELRDIVYGFLLDELNETWKVVDDGSIVSKPRPTRPLKKPRVIQYLSQSLIHEGIAKEMAEEFFMHSKFEMEHPCEGLRRFLCSEDFGANFEAKEYIRHIAVNLHPPGWACEISQQTEPQMEKYLRGLGCDLNLLLTIRHPEKCTLIFHLGGRYPGRKMRVLQFMAPYARRARMLGFQFQLYVATDAEFSFNVESPTTIDNQAVRFEDYEEK